jgi:hypothetical protein
VTNVTQEDREAAAAIIKARPMVENCDIISHGGADDGAFVQAFARHREQARAEAIEQAVAKVEGSWRITGEAKIALAKAIRSLSAAQGGVRGG